MDLFLIIGVVGGMLTVVVGMIVKGANVAVLMNPAAVIIIFIGTAMAVLNSFPKKEILKFPKILGVLFKDHQGVEPKEILDKIADLAESARRDGLLSLESKITNMENKFMKKGLNMVIDGVVPELVKEVLSGEIEAMEERHRLGATIFSTAGGAAPTLGVLGAVIGLIGALGNLNDVERLGHMIAAAFVATLFGIFTGYVICHPFASRLKRKSHEEISMMLIMVEGILSIQAGENPRSIKLKLSGLLAPEDREKESEQPQ